MKKLLLITQGFPFGESERSFLTTEFEELMRAFEVSILAYGLEDKLLYPLPETVRVFRYEIEAMQPARLAIQIFKPGVWQDIKMQVCVGIGKQTALRAGKILAYSLRAEQLKCQLQQIVEAEKIDLIYTYWCTQATVAALRLKEKFPKLKVVTRFHGVDLYLERTQIGWQLLRGFIEKKSDKLIFACEAGKNYFAKYWGENTEEKYVVAYLGSRAMPQVIPADTNELVLVSCSNLVPLKRVELIIEALALLPEEMKISWNHLGDGPERERLEKLAKEKLGKKGNIHWKFWGKIPNREIEQPYLKLKPNLFITTSSTEGGAPISIVEAFAMGIPAIGTAVGGIPELVKDGITGFVLPVDTSPAEIAHAISRFTLLLWEKRKTIGLNAFDLWQQKFDANKNARKFVETLQHIE